MTLKFAPGWTIILIFALVMSPVAGAADLPVAPSICFSAPDGERILRDLESLEDCQQAVDSAKGAVKSSEERAVILEERIVELDEEVRDAQVKLEETRKAGERAVKVAAGPWYQRILAAGKWIALGIVIGFVGGMAN